MLEQALNQQSNRNFTKVVSPRQMMTS